MASSPARSSRPSCRCWAGPGRPAHSADYERKLQAATKARDEYLATRRDEFAGGLESAALANISGPPTNSASIRGNPKLDERALADKLNSRRLRAVIAMWKRCLGVDAQGRRPGVRPVERICGARPGTSSRPGRREVYGKLTASNEAKNAKPVHPLVAKIVLAGPPASMDEVVERYAALFGQLEARWKENAAQVRRPTACPSRMGVAPAGTVRHERTAARFDRC